MKTLFGIKNKIGEACYNRLESGQRINVSYVNEFRFACK